MRDLTTIPPAPSTRRIAYGGDPNQFIDVFESTTPSRCTLMFIHGGFWRAKYDLTHASHFCAALAGSGVNVANVEYRRVGNAGGGWPGTFEDIKLALAATGRLFPNQAVITCGHSAGGHLALRLACERLVQHATLVLAPVAILCDAYELHLSSDAVVEFLGGAPSDRPEVYDDACPSMHSLTIPATVIHGTNDDTVPISISRNYRDARRDDQVRLLELQGFGHMELIDPESEAFSIVATALNDLLR